MSFLGGGHHSTKDIVLMSIRGDKAVMKRLKKLEPKIRKQVLNKAAKTAMRPVLTAARNNAPKKTGALRKAIRLRALKRNRRGNVGARVACSDQWFVGDMFYGAFQEFGYHIGKRENSMRSRGIWSGIGSDRDTRREVAGQHFIERAFRTHGERAMQTFMEEVPREIDKALGIGGE